MKKWFLIIRPATLFATLSPVFVGLFLALQSGSFHLATAVVVLCSALSIQIVSNLVNDYFDYKKGSDREGRLGPDRAISKGEITADKMQKAIAVAMITAVCSGLILVWEGGLPIVLIGVSALCFAWLYTATRFSLSYLGIADLFVFGYFGPIASAGTYYLQSGTYSSIAMLTGVGCGLISMAVLTVNNTRDYVQDARNGKKTVVVRLGLRFATIYYALTILIPTLLLWRTASICSAILYLPFALLILRLFINASGREYNRVLALTGMLNLIYLIALIVGKQ